MKASFAGSPLDEGDKCVTAGPGRVSSNERATPLDALEEFAIDTEWAHTGNASRATSRKLASNTKRIMFLIIKIASLLKNASMAPG
jgi:hypothetical protein